MVAAADATQTDWEAVPRPGPAAAAPVAAQAPMTGSLSDLERNWAPWVHISALASFVVPLGNILGPLVCWLITKERSAFLNDQGKQALNFQIAVTIAAGILFVIGMVSMVLFILVVPFLIAILAFIAMSVVILVGLIFAVVGGIQASRGVWYRYPVSFQFVK